MKTRLTLLIFLYKRSTETRESLLLNLLVKQQRCLRCVTPPPQGGCDARTDQTSDSLSEDFGSNPVRRRAARGSDHVTFRKQTVACVTSLQFLLWLKMQFSFLRNSVLTNQLCGSGSAAQTHHKKSVDKQTNSCGVFALVVERFVFLLFKAAVVTSS